MLNRHHLRIKAMHSLYAYFSSDDVEIAKGEKELFRSIDKVYDLYIRQLSILPEILHIAEKAIEDNKHKRLPSKEDLQPNLRFIQNKALILINNNAELKSKINDRRISWQSDIDIVKKIFNNIRNSEEYKVYMAKPESTFEEDRKFIADIYANYIAENDLLINLYEEQTIYWVDDFFLINSSVIKTIESFDADSNGSHRLLPLYRDPEDDKKFVTDLYRYSILMNKDTEKMIAEKTQNWEVERIAMMDILLMKMALTELIHFKSIPVKVSLNEYIELSKEYSTPKSKVFVNGILDKLVADLKRDNKIQKTGRGLME